MLKLLVFLLLAPAPQTLGEAHIKFHDRNIGPTPVTDKDLRPMKPPDCRTAAEVQRTLEQLKLGERGDCFIRDRTAFGRD